MSIVETVARALHESDIPDAPWEGRSDGWKDRYRCLARAAIAAMREPPPPMSELFDHDEAVDWISADCVAIRRDNGDMDYSLGAMIKAYEAGKAAAMQGQPVAWMYQNQNKSHPTPEIIASARWVERDRPGWTETPLYALPPAPEVSRG